MKLEGIRLAMAQVIVDMLCMSVAYDDSLWEAADDLRRRLGNKESSLSLYFCGKLYRKLLEQKNTGRKAT